MRPGALHAAPPAPVLWNLPGLPGSVDAYGKRIQGVAAWEALPAFTTADHSPLENAATWSLPSRPRGVFLSPLENPAHPSDGWPGFTTASTHQRRRRPIMAHERRQSEDPRGPTWPLTSTGNHSRRYAPTLATFVGLGGHLGRNAHSPERHRDHLALRLGRHCRIQRPFVWQASDARDLLDPLLRGFPVGLLIARRNSLTFSRMPAAAVGRH